MDRRPTLIVPVGLPCAGKSTLSKRLLSMEYIEPAAVVSPDHYRYFMTGNSALQHRNKEVFEVCHTIAQVRLQEGLDVFFDATNITHDAVRKIEHIAHIGSADSVLVVFTTPTEECLARNAARLTPVPDDAMERMIDRLVQFEPYTAARYSRVYSSDEYLEFAKHEVASGRGYSPRPID